MLLIGAAIFVMRLNEPETAVGPDPATASPPAASSTVAPDSTARPAPSRSPAPAAADLCPATITPSDVTCLTDGRGYTSAGQAGFLPGLRFEAPPGLKLSAQQANVLRFSAVDRPSNQEILFVLDPVPAGADARPVTGVAKTPAALADWFAGNDAYIVSPPEQVTIGNGINATTFTTAVSPIGTNDDPDCLRQEHEGMAGRPYASVCKYVVQPRGWNRPLSYGTTSTLRWYLMTIGPKAEPAMLAVMVHGDVLQLVEGDVDDPAVALTGAERLARPILDSLRLPTE